jgi:hypothetical protein
MWLGIGDLINRFRTDMLNLPSLNMREATTIMINERVPYTHCWSPSLVPRPADWPDQVDISGFFFLDLSTTYTNPSHQLIDFLGLPNGTHEQTAPLAPPVFIGFGSITGHDADRLLDVILTALHRTGYRALLSGFNVSSERLTKNILQIGEMPYDWLFQHGSCRVEPPIDRSIDRCHLNF